MKIQNLENGLVKITPDSGKELIYKRDKKQHSEAVVKENEIQYFYEENKERREEYGKD